MALNFRRLLTGLGIVGKTTLTSDTLGELEVSSTTNKLYFNNGTTASAVLTEGQSGPITNKLLIDNSVEFANVSDNTKQLDVSLSGATTATKTTLVSSQTANRALTLPNVTDTLTANAASQVLTNKSIDADNNTISNIDNDDIRSDAAIQRSKLASGTNYRILANNSSGVMSENGALTANQVVKVDANGQLASEAQLTPDKGGTGIGSYSTGDILYASNSSTLVNLGIGSSNQVLTVNSGLPSWQPAPSGTLPSGMMSPFGGSSAPSGWFLCDGSAVSRTTYSNLFAIISTTYGVGDGSTTFNLPDTRGIFLRGAGTSGQLNNASGSPFSGTLGSYQNDKFQNFAISVADAAASSWVNGSSVGCGIITSTGTDIMTSTLAANGNGTPRIGSETNPANLGVNYIIKQ